MPQKKFKNNFDHIRRTVEISRKPPTTIVLKKHSPRREAENFIEREEIPFLQVKKYHPEKEFVPEQEEIISASEETFPDIKEEMGKAREEEKPEEKIIYFEHTQTRRPGLIRRKALVLVGMVTVIVILTLLSTVFARLSVTFKPKVEDLSLRDIVVAFDASVSQILLNQKVIPAEKLEFTKNTKQDFPATGRKNVEERAGGGVKIYNAYSSSPQKLISSTRFLADSGTLYRLASGVTVPGAKIEEGKIVPQYIEAQVVADQPGESANAGGEIKLKIPGLQGTPKYDSFYAVAPNGFSGGFKGLASVVTKDDLAQAQQEVTKNAYNQIKSDVSKQLPQEFKMLDGLQEVQITKVISPKENSVADRFAVEVQTKARVIIFREKDAVSLVSNILINRDQNKKYVENSANFSYQIQKVDFEKGKAVVAIKGDMKSVAIVSESALADTIRGKKYGSINNLLLARPELASFNVSFFPPWISSAPDNPEQIKLKVDNP